MQAEQQRDGKPGEIDLAQGAHSHQVLEQRESWVRARMWIAEAADERRATQYIPDTVSHAYGALYLYSGVRLKKIEHASRRAFDRQAFQDRTHIDTLPAEGRKDVEAARHHRRLLIAAGGNTTPARLAAHHALQREAAERGDPEAQREIARLRAINAGIDGWKWGITSCADGDDDWGVGEKWGASVESAVAAADSALTVAAADSALTVAAADSALAAAAPWAEEIGGEPVWSAVRTLPPPPWWMTHPGAELEEVDDAPSPPRYSKALPFV